MSDALYFGCWQSVGHGFYAPGMEWFHGGQDAQPWGYDVEHLPPSTSREQGAAALLHRGGWTALAVHDYTVDPRGNSKSVFLFRGTLGFLNALVRASAVFPEVVGRLGTVTLAEPDVPPAALDGGEQP